MVLSSVPVLSPQLMDAVKSPALADALASVKLATITLPVSSPSVALTGVAVTVMTWLATDASGVA